MSFLMIRDVDDESTAGANPSVASAMPAQRISGILQSAPAVPGPFSNWPGFNVTPQATSDPSAGQVAANQQQTLPTFPTSASAASQQVPIQQQFQTGAAPPKQQFQPTSTLTPHFLSQSAR